MKIDFFQSLAISIFIEFIIAVTAYFVKNEKARIFILGIGTILACIIGFIGPMVLKGIGTISFQPETSSVEGIKNDLDCSNTTELGSWLTLTTVTFNPNRDGWVQADFWSTFGQLIEGYDEVSVIFEPSLRVTINNVEGIAWHYDKSTWNQEEVEWCTQKHVDDSWNIRQKRLIIITPAKLCSILPCQ
ncbi:MAG: hypothetical protein ABIU06_16820 [Anaerolineales bacterium]